MLRYNILLILAGSIGFGKLTAQELFVYTEPSSNMPARSVGLRLSNWLMNDATGPVKYNFVPEVMWGVNKRLMFHLEGFFGNRPGSFKAEGAGVYAKYRFYSRDKIYKHLRLAAFGRIAINNGYVYEEEVATNSHNTGYQLGLIGTQLLHKTALSVTAYYERALDNLNGYSFPPSVSGRALNYDLSVGRLIFPKAYTSYKQTNMNIMAEFLGQSLMNNGRQFVDGAIALQFIFNSQTRLDIGYRHELYSSMSRMDQNGLLVRAEHLLYNVF